MFPQAFVEGVGLTGFKVVSEYLIVTVLVLSMISIIKKKKAIGGNLPKYVFLSIAATIISELMFTLYVDVYGLFNFLGHLFKLVSYWLLLEMVFSISLRGPLSAMKWACDLYEACQLPVAVIGGDGVVRYVSGAALESLDLSEEDVVGKHCHSIFHARDTAAGDCRICRHIEKSIPMDRTEIEIEKDKDWRLFSLVRLRAAGAEDGMLQISWDISETKQVQSHIAQTAKLATLGEMASGLAHDVNQPLSVMGLTLGEALMDIEDGNHDVASLKKKLERATSQVERISYLSNNILRLARKNSPKLQQFNVCDAMDSTIGMIEGQLQAAGIGLIDGETVRWQWM